MKSQFPDEDVRAKLSEHFSEEFGLPDWDQQVTVIEKILDDSSAGNSKKGPSRKHPEILEPLFPECLCERSRLSRIRTELLEMCETRRAELNKQIEREKQRKQE